MRKEYLVTSTGFTLIEVITTLVIFSFAVLMIATVLGASYLRVEQIVTQQEDVRDVASCVERIKASFWDKSASEIVNSVETLRNQCGTDISIDVQAKRAAIGSDKDKTVTLENCDPDAGEACSIRFITVSKGDLEFNYVLGR